MTQNEATNDDKNISELVNEETNAANFQIKYSIGQEQFNQLISKSNVSTDKDENRRRLLRSSSFSTFLVPRPPDCISSKSGVLENNIARLWARSAPSSPNHLVTTNNEAFKGFQPRLRSEKKYYCLPSEFGTSSQFTSLLQPQSVDRFVYKIMRQSHAVERRKPVAPIVVGSNAGDAAKNQSFKNSIKAPNLQTNSFLSPQTVVVANGSTTSDTSKVTGSVLDINNSLRSQSQTSIHNVLPKKPIHHISSAPSLITNTVKKTTLFPPQSSTSDLKSSFANDSISMDSGSEKSINAIAERLKNQATLNLIESEKKNGSEIVKRDIDRPVSFVYSKINSVQDSASDYKINSNWQISKTESLSHLLGSYSSASASNNTSNEKKKIESVEVYNIMASNAKNLAEKKVQLHQRPSSAAVIRLHVDKPLVATNGALSSVPTVCVAVPNLTEVHNFQNMSQASNNTTTISTNAMTSIDMSNSRIDLNIMSRNSLTEVSSTNGSKTVNLITLSTTTSKTDLPPRPRTTVKTSNDVSGHFKPPKPPHSTPSAAEKSSSRMVKPINSIHHSSSMIGLNSSVTTSTSTRPLPILKQSASVDSNNNNNKNYVNGTKLSKSSSETVLNDECSTPSEFDRYASCKKF